MISISTIITGVLTSVITGLIFLIVLAIYKLFKAVTSAGFKFSYKGVRKFISSRKEAKKDRELHRTLVYIYQERLLKKLEKDESLRDHALYVEYLAKQINKSPKTKKNKHIKKSRI